MFFRQWREIHKDVRTFVLETQLLLLARENPHLRCQQNILHLVLSCFYSVAKQIATAELA